jgi:cyclophilin family peptidyl-prolyl cis-trans isomerase
MRTRAAPPACLQVATHVRPYPPNAPVTRPAPIANRTCPDSPAWPARRQSCRHLDFKHSVFGRIVGGLEVLSAMEKIPTDPDDRPTQPITITGAIAAGVG